MTLSWSYNPFKRLLCPDDVFFEEGNIQCNILRKQTNHSEVEDINEWSAAEFKCSIAGCREYFANIKRYETHYRSSHWNTCRFCKKSFQTSFLLDLHILENHDTLFQIISKKNYMYQCLVESCPDKFGGEEDRKRHLVKVHNYPSDFRFNKPSRTQRKLRRQNVDIREQAAGNESLQGVPMESDITNSSSDSTSHKHLQNRTPKTFCFGRGSSRGFHRGVSSRGHTRGKKKKKSMQGLNTHEVTMKDIS